MQILQFLGSCNPQPPCIEVTQHIILFLVPERTFWQMFSHESVGIVSVTGFSIYTLFLLDENHTHTE